MSYFVSSEEKDESERQWIRDDENLRSLRVLSGYHLEREGYRQARTYLGQLASLQEGKDIDTWFTLCICCVMAGDLLEARYALQEAMNMMNTLEKQRPKDGNQNVNRVYGRTMDHALDDEDLFNSNDTLKHVDVRILFCRGMLFMRSNKQLDKANIIFKIIMEVCNKKLKLPNPDPDMIAGLSHLNDTDRAFYKQIREDTLLQLVVLSQEAKNFNASIAMCNKILQEDPSTSAKATSQMMIGLLSNMKGDERSAELAYRAAVDIMPAHVLSLERLGRIYLRHRGTIHFAVTCFRKAIEVNPGDAKLWYLLGRCYMATYQYKDAGDAYGKAINLDPNDADIWCSLGILYHAFGQYQEALTMFFKALMLRPTMSEAWYNMGALYQLCDMAEDAEVAYKKARQHGLEQRFAKVGLH
jgi:hypothetical protein